MPGTDLLRGKAIKPAIKAAVEAVKAKRFADGAAMYLSDSGGHAQRLKERHITRWIASLGL